MCTELSQEQITRISKLLSKIPISDQINGNFIPTVNNDIIIEDNSGEQTENKNEENHKELKAEEKQESLTGIFEIEDKQKECTKQEENNNENEEEDKNKQQKQLESWLDDLLG